MPQEPTCGGSGILSLFQPKILAAIYYIRNGNKQHPDAEAIYKYILERKHQMLIKPILQILLMN